ncbi:MAG: cysteine desulfurase [Lachnospiraceae bacterium]|nr:cysteine desulfurase [Lachnospiraceae bacterium]
MKAYLDNSATTRTFDEVTEYMADVMRNNFGNPSSMHMVGINAENEIKTAKDSLAGILKVDAKDIYFTSGGTESDNLAIIGCALANRRDGMHIITTRTEHPAVLETMGYLEEQGFDVTYLDVTKDGRVDPKALENALTDDTILVSIMHVNNEIGSVNDIEKLADIVKDYRPSILFHTDAVQSFGKTKIYPKRMKIDLMSVSAHKIHGPKGVGFLYINEKVKILPVIFGGGQQKGIRSGTENVPGIAGLGMAARLINDGLDAKIERLFELKSYFINELTKMENVTVNGIPDTEGTVEDAVRMTAPHIVSASFAGVRAEVLLHALEAKEIYVSSGSACSTNKPAKSATLLAIDLDRNLLDSTIRFSFSVETTREELDYTLSVLAEELPKLRKYARR